MSNQKLDWSLYNRGGNINHLSKKIIEICQKTSPGVAIDLGCGSGEDALFFVKNGWIVFGVDTDISFALKKKLLLPINEYLRYNLIQENIENFLFPFADLIYAFDSLFFCDLRCFDKIWENIYNHLSADGIFSATLIGDKDHLALYAQNVIFFTITDIIKKLEISYKILDFQESYQDRLITNLKTGKHTLAKRHCYSFIVQKTGGF